MNPYEQYQQQVVTTMTQGDMLLKLYDEIIKQIGVAKQCIVAGRVEEMDKAISKAEEIVRYLRSMLDFRIPVSANLAKLYDFFNTQLVAANVKKDTQPLDDIVPLVQDLRATFDECARLDRAKRTGRPAVGNVV